MHFKLIAIGKLKNKHLSAECAKFAEWLAPYAKFELTELPDTGDKTKEKEHFLRALGNENHYFLVVLSEEGKLFTSEELAAKLGKIDRKIIFLIGGPDGVDDTIKAQADLLWSLSPLTFTHEIARMLLTEQLYRAMSIRRGGKYHRS